MTVEVASSLWDYMVDVFTVLSAIVSTVLVILIYRWQKKDDAEKERRRWKNEQINNFLLVPKLDYIRGLFKKINENTDLLSEATALTDKSDIYNFIDENLNDFTSQFVELVYAIDEKWYNNIVNITDEYRDSLSGYLFDETEGVAANEVAITARQMTALWQNRILNLLLSYEVQDKKRGKNSNWKYVVIAVSIALLIWILYKYCGNTEQADDNRIIIEIEQSQIDQLVNSIVSSKADTVYTIPVKKQTTYRRSKERNIQVDCVKDTTKENSLHLDLVIKEK